MRDAIVGIPGLLEDATTTFNTFEGYHGTPSTNNWLEEMLQRLVDKVVHEKLRFMEFEIRLPLTTEVVNSSRQHLTKMMGAMLHDQDFMVPGATIVKKESEKPVDVEWKTEDRRRKFIEVAYSTSALLTSSSHRSPMEKSDEERKRRSTPNFHIVRHRNYRRDKCEGLVQK